MIKEGTHKKTVRCRLGDQVYDVEKRYIKAEAEVRQEAGWLGTCMSSGTRDSHIMPRVRDGM